MEKLDESDFKAIKNLNEQFGIYYCFVATKPNKKGYNIDFVSHINEQQEIEIRKVLGLNK